jgi:hypothetical protein
MMGTVIQGTIWITAGLSLVALLARVRKKREQR